MKSHDQHPDTWIFVKEFLNYNKRKKSVLCLTILLVGTWSTINIVQNTAVFSRGIT